MQSSGADIAAEGPTLAISSSTYWEANLDEWQDEYRDDDDDPQQISTASNVAAEPVGCGGGVIKASLRTRAPWVEIGAVAGADVIGAFGIVGDLVNGYMQVHESWSKAGRGYGNERALVRAMVPSTAGQVVAGAKLVARKALLTGFWGAAASSAFAVM